MKYYNINDLDGISQLIHINSEDDDLYNLPGTSVIKVNNVTGGPNLYNSDGVPIIDKESIKERRINGTDLYEIFAKQYNVDIVEYNILSPDGTFLLDTWKGLGECVNILLNDDYKMSESLEDVKHRMIVSRGMNADNSGKLRLLNKIYIVEKDNLKQFCDIEEYNNVIRSCKDVYIGRYFVEKTKSHKYNIIGEDFNLMSERDFDTIAKMSNGESRYYRATVGTGDSALHNIYDTKKDNGKGGFIQDSWFTIHMDVCQHSRWSYCFIKDVNGVCRIIDWTAFVENNNDDFKFIGGTFDKILKDDDADMFVAVSGDKMFVLNGDELFETNEFRFFYLENNVIVRFFLSYDEEKWNIIEIKLVKPGNEPKLNCEEKFDSFDSLCCPRVVIYNEDKQNVLDSFIGIGFPGNWFDEVDPYNYEQVRYCCADVVDGGKKWFVCNENGKIQITGSNQ